MTATGAAVSDILAPNPSTFYLFENRQRNGDTPWDKYLKGSGMMITKVQWSRSKWEDNTVNNYSSNMGVDIIEAKTNTSSYTDKASDLYPEGSSEFTDIVLFPVTDIKMEDRIVTFNVKGGWPEEIENVQPAGNKVQKTIENGQVIILRDGQKFDVLGNRL